MTETSTLVFHEDRRWLHLRVWPIILPATYFWFMVVIFVAMPSGRREFVHVTGWIQMFWIVALITLFRVDVWQLMLSRRVRYEIDDNEFRAYRGRTLKVSVPLDNLERWTAPGSFSRKWLYFGMCYGGNWSIPYMFGPDFSIKNPDGRPGLTISAPFLFRWSHLGGADDVSEALTERIGWGPGWKPWDSS